jgi:hypothetical protein
MDIKERIAGLPEWPERFWPAIASRPAYEKAALARLALAREWIEQSEYAGHATWCEQAPNFIEGCVCACGRDALLKALEVPRG